MMPYEQYSRDNCGDGLPHSRTELIKAFTTRFFTRERVYRVRKYGFWWVVHGTICHTRGDLYWDYVNGRHPADAVLERTNRLAKRLMRRPSTVR